MLGRARNLDAKPGILAASAFIRQRFSALRFEDFRQLI
jgi:hypothetical protein